jgi:hypothetical protein
MREAKSAAVAAALADRGANAKKNRQAAIKKAQEARAIKVAAKRLVERKVAENLPISEEERNLLTWKNGNQHGKSPTNLAIAAVAKLVMKPQSVNELRMLVEKTAAKHSYNPIEALIQLTQSNHVEEKEKIAIHKALLPFLVPVLATPKVSQGEESGGGVKVVVTQFHFPNSGKPSGPLHMEKPVTVTTTEQ